MPSSPPWIPTAGAPPPGAAQAMVYTSPSECHSAVKEAGAVASITRESRERVPPLENLEAETLEHEEKVNKYQGLLAARLKAKYFSSKAFGKGMFEETTIQSETILSSRCPFSNLFANPTKFRQERTRSEECICPSLAVGSFGKHSP